MFCLLFSEGLSRITEAEALFSLCLCSEITAWVILEMFTRPVKGEVVNFSSQEMKDVVARRAATPK